MLNPETRGLWPPHRSKNYSLERSTSRRTRGEYVQNRPGASRGLSPGPAAPCWVFPSRSFQKPQISSTTHAGKEGNYLARVSQLTFIGQSKESPLGQQHPLVAASENHHSAPFHASPSFPKGGQTHHLHLLPPPEASLKPALRIYSLPLTQTFGHWSPLPYFLWAGPGAWWGHLGIMKKVGDQARRIRS